MQPNMCDMSLRMPVLSTEHRIWRYEIQSNTAPLNRSQPRLIFSVIVILIPYLFYLLLVPSLNFTFVSHQVL